MSSTLPTTRAEATKPRKGELTRLRILEAAAAVLDRDGYAAATLTEIASVAKMQAGSLYYHFDSKDAIVEEVLRVGVDHAREAICEALHEAGPEANGHDQLIEAMQAYVQRIAAESSFTRANIRCFQEAPRAARESLAVPLREFANLWVGLLERGQRDGSIRADLEPRVIARMTIAALNSCVQWYRDDGDLSIDRVASMFATGLVDGLAN